MIKDNNHKRFLKSAEDIYELLSAINLDNTKSSDFLNKVTLKILQLIREETLLRKAVNENFDKENPHPFKNYISDILESLEKQKRKVLTLMETSIISYDGRLYEIYKRNFEELGQHLLFYKDLAIKNRLSYEKLLDFFYLILIALTREIKLLLSTLRPEDWPSEEVEEMQLFIKKFRPEREKAFMKVDQPFKDQEVADACYEVLIKVELIDKNFNYTGSFKGGIYLWHDKLSQLKINGENIIENLRLSEYHRLLNKKIHNLNARYPLFKKYGNDVREKYSAKMDIYFRDFPRKFEGSAFQSKS